MLQEDETRDGPSSADDGDEGRQPALRATTAHGGGGGCGRDGSSADGDNGDDGKEVKRRTIAEAAVRFLARNPIEERGDVKFGWQVRELVATLDVDVFERTSVELIAYFIREPKQAEAFIKAFIEHYQQSPGNVHAALLAGLTSAEQVDMKGVERFLPTRGLRWFSPKNLKRLIVDDPAREKKEKDKFDDLVRAVIDLDKMIERGTDEDVLSAVTAVLVRKENKKIDGFAGPGTYFSEHLVRDRFVKLHAPLPGDELTKMSQGAAEHFVELRGHFTGIADVNQTAHTLDLEETPPLLDLGTMRYVLCMICKAVSVKKGESFLAVARRYLDCVETNACRAPRDPSSQGAAEHFVQGGAAESQVFFSVCAGASGPPDFVLITTRNESRDSTAPPRAWHSDNAGQEEHDEAVSEDNNDGVVEFGKGGCLAVAFYHAFRHYGYNFLDVEGTKALFNEQITGGQNKGVAGDWWLSGCILSALKGMFGKGKFTFKRATHTVDRLFPLLAQDLGDKVLIVDGELNWPDYYFDKDRYDHPALPPAQQSAAASSTSSAQPNRHSVAIIHGNLFDLSLPVLQRHEDLATALQRSVPAAKVLHLDDDGSFKRDETGKIMGYFRQIFKVFHVVLPPPTQQPSASPPTSRRRKRRATRPLSPGAQKKQLKI